jgi:hypothetical protein
MPIGFFKSLPIQPHLTNLRSTRRPPEDMDTSLQLYSHSTRTMPPQVDLDLAGNRIASAQVSVFIFGCDGVSNSRGVFRRVYLPDCVRRVGCQEIYRRRVSILTVSILPFLISDSIKTL